MAKQMLRTVNVQTYICSIALTSATPLALMTPVARRNRECHDERLILKRLTIGI